jgi:tripartite-type tricarboxylate transporter receptor subunit TctC
MNRIIVGSTAASVALALSMSYSEAQAQAGKPAAAYPTKPIRIVIPYPPGGTSDTLARLLGMKITENWGQQVIVENRTGASGNIGAEVAARAAPDGYTFLLTDIGNLSNSPNVYKLPFDVFKDLAPVTTVSYSPHMLTVHPSVPVKTTRELIALAKANPGKLNVPSGIGTAPHFAGMLFAQAAGINWVYIGTRGGADTSRAVMSGEGDVLFLGMLQTYPHVKSGRLKLLAVTGAQRHPSLPDTPTVGETPGFSGFVTGSWQGVLAPARVSPEIITKVNAELVRILSLPDIKAKLSTQGADPLTNTPQDTAKWLVAENARYAKLIKDTGFKLQ